MTAPNSKIPERCTWCSSEATLWLRQSPDCWHVFRVECRDNHHFLKWGTEGQFEEARRRRLNVAEVPYDQNQESGISRAKNNQTGNQRSGQTPFP